MFLEVGELVDELIEEYYRRFDSGWEEGKRVFPEVDELMEKWMEECWSWLRSVGGGGGPY